MNPRLLPVFILALLVAACTLLTFKSYGADAPAAKPPIVGAVVFQVNSRNMWIVFVYNDGHVWEIDADDCASQADCKATYLDMQNKDLIDLMNVVVAPHGSTQTPDADEKVPDITT